MIRDVLAGVGGIGVYGIVALLLFLGIFAGVLAWIARIRPPYIKKMKNLPLENDRADRGNGP